MASLRHISRRQFISTAATSSAASVLATPALSFAFGDAARVRGAFDLGGATSALMAWQDQGVINVANSPYAKLHSVPVHAVTIEEGFWSKRRKTNVERSIPTMRQELEQQTLKQREAFQKLGQDLEQDVRQAFEQQMQKQQENVRRLVQELEEQTQKQQEAFQKLVQASMEVSKNLLYTPLSYYQ